MESCGKYWIPVFNALEKSGINVCLTHPKYVKAIKSATRVLDALLEHGSGDFELDGLIHAKCKSSPEKIRAALDGELDHMQTEKLNLIRRHMNNLNDLKAALEKLIYKLAANYQPQIDLLMTVPGIRTQLTAIRILAEIGADMSVFETAPCSNRAELWEI